MNRYQRQYYNIYIYHINLSIEIIFFSTFLLLIYTSYDYCKDNIKEHLGSLQNLLDLEKILIFIQLIILLDVDFKICHIQMLMSQINMLSQITHLVKFHYTILLGTAKWFLISVNPQVSIELTLAFKGFHTFLILMANKVRVLALFLNFFIESLSYWTMAFIYFKYFVFVVLFKHIHHKIISIWNGLCIGI